MNWISVKDKLPTSADNPLLLFGVPWCDNCDHAFAHAAPFLHMGYYTNTIFHSVRDEFRDTKTDKKISVSHWMRMPQYPEGWFTLYFGRDNELDKSKR